MAFGACSSGAVTPGGYDGGQKQQENYAKESFHPNSLLFKNRRFSPIRLGFKVFLDYAFYQYFQDNSISFLRFSPISEEKAFLNEATNFFIQPSPLNRFRFPIKHCFSLLEPDLEYAFYQYLSNISIIFWHFTLQWDSKI